MLNYLSLNNCNYLQKTTSNSSDTYQLNLSHSRVTELIKYSEVPTVNIWSHFLVKISFKSTFLWTCGMLSNLLFTASYLQSKNFLNEKNSRKEWGIWNYAYTIFWSTANSYSFQRYSPWSIRIRRFFKLTSLSGTFNFVKFKESPQVTPKRRIKRWLKKKYTTQSWR